MLNINGLPPEIFGLIFMLFHEDLKRGQVNIGLAAVCLTCKRWNDLALSTPELWSFIEIIRDPVSSPMPNLPSYSKVSTWLDRSQNWPLSLAVIGVRGKRFNPLEVTSLKAVLPLLVAHSHRWRRVSFGFSPWFQPTDVDVHLPHTFIAPILESVEVICNSYNEGPRDHIFYERLLRGCPALRSYTSNPFQSILPPDYLPLEQFRRNQSVLPPDYLPWEQLRNLEVAHPATAADALMLLGRAVNLRSCCLTIGPHYTRRPSLESVTSPIKFLTINSHTVSGLGDAVWGSGENMKRFFRSLDAPNLTDLSIGFILDHHMTHAILSDILSKPCLRLSSLTLVNLAIFEDEFLDCLTLLSESLTTLKILRLPEGPVYRAVRNKIINLLTFHGEGSPKPLFPFLETLTLELCVGADDGLLTHMVRSRRRSPRTLRDHGIALLKRLDVVFVPRTHSLDVEGLKEMYGEGLRGGVKFFID